MRIRLPVGRTLFFAAAFVFALVALFPMRLAIDWIGLDERGLAAREANGSVWIGALAEAQLGPVPIGDVEAGLDTLPLFLGRARVGLERDDAARPFAGAATVSGDRFGLDDVTAQLPVGALFAPLPVTSLDLSDLTAHFADGLCVEAEGLVRANVAGELGGVLLPGGLSGNARCDEGALLLPLASQSGLERLDLRLWADGRYRLDLAVRPTDPALGERLRAAGFVPAGSGYALTTEGRL